MAISSRHALPDHARPTGDREREQARWHPEREILELATAPLRRRFSCAAGPNRLKVTAAQLVLRRLSMQKWELTYEIVGSAIAIGALLVLLWYLGLAS